MIDLKLNKDRLGSHWHYYRLKYAVVLLAGLFVANLLFTVTEPKTPPNLKVDIQLVSDAYYSEAIGEWQQNLLCLLPPDQKEMNLEALALMSAQGVDISTVLAAKMAAHEGTIWILPSDIFMMYAQQRSFIALDKDISSFNLPKDIDLSGGKAVVKMEDTDPGVTQLCGIPLDKCTGLSALFVVKGMVLCFPQYADVNYENAKIIANYLLSRTDTPIGITAAGNTGFKILIAAQSFSSYDISALQKEIQGVVKAAPEEASISLIPYHIGREGFVSELLLSRVENNPSGMFVVTREVFVDLARKGALMPLDNVSYLLKLPEGIDLSTGKERATLKDKTAGPEQLYGIPVGHCAGLSTVFNPAGMFIVFPTQPVQALSVAIDAANILLEKTEESK